MTEPTPPPPGATPSDHGADPVDAVAELVHASVDGELSAAEEQAIRPDEAWRARVEQARAERDVVRAALAVGPVDKARREDHLAAALAAFDENARRAPVAVVPPSSAHHPAPPPPGAVPGDQLAARRQSREWVRKLPVGIAAAVLAAVVVLGATQMRGDGDDDTETATAPDESREVDTRTEADLGAANEAPPTANDSASESGDDGMASYELANEPTSLEGFADAVVRVGRGGDAMPDDASRTSAPRLDSDCSKQDIMELVDAPDADELTLLEGSVGGRDLVGVVVGTDYSQVTIIDLDRCEVVSE